MPRSVLGLLVTLGLLLVGSLATGATASAGGGCHGEVDGDVHTDGETSVVRMDVCSFGPTVARVPVGAEVTFLNTAPNEHIVLGRGSTWGGRPLAPRAEFVQAFAEPGIFPYSCPLHPGMVGAIVVGDADVVPAAIVDSAPVTDSGAAATPDTTASAAPVDPWLVGGGGLLAGAALGGLIAILVRRRREPGPTTV